MSLITKYFKKSDEEDTRKRFLSSSSEGEGASPDPSSKRINDLSTPPISPVLAESAVSPVQMDQEERLAILNLIEAKLDKLATAEALADLAKKFEERMERMEGRLHDMVLENDALAKKVGSLQEENGELRERLATVERAQNDNEQYARRWNLRVAGVPERSNEKEEDNIQACLKLFNKELGVAVRKEDIEALHRTGRKKEGDAGKSRPRQIIVRFTNRRLRDRVIGERKKLKNKGYSISEDLTYANLKLEQQAYRHKDTQSTWSVGGTIFAKLQNGRTVRLRVGQDIDKVLSEANREGAKQ